MEYDSSGLPKLVGGVRECVLPASWDLFRLLPKESFPEMVVDTEAESAAAYWECKGSRSGYYRPDTQQIRLHHSMLVRANVKEHAAAFGVYLAITILHHLAHWMVGISSH